MSKAKNASASRERGLVVTAGRLSPQEVATVLTQHRLAGSDPHLPPPYGAMTE